MSLPVSGFSDLSLDEMTPLTRSMSRAASMAASSYRAELESSSDLDSDLENSDLDEDSPKVVRSPTRLTYRLDRLSDKSKSAVRDVFSEPPKMALQRCRLINNTYAFQMTELVTRSVRIHAPDEGTSRLTCSCGSNDEPCEHLLWLLDQLLKQTLYNHDYNKPLTMKPEGYAEEMGDPFQSIADYHLDVLADGLHCQVVHPETDPDEPLSPHRVLESRELLSSVYAAQPESFRPDIFTHPTPGKAVIKRHDLDCTVFRMLVDNHHFFQYFLSKSRASDPINDSFRKLSQRVDHVLRALDVFSSSQSGSATPGISAESPINVAWAAKHILGSVQLIRSAIFTRESPLQPQEATSAARTLIHILSSVVARNRDVQNGSSRLDRNLYLRLIGDHDGDFVTGELNLLPEAASQFLHNLESILDMLGVHGAPTSYVDKFRNLISRLRTSTSGFGLKRHVQTANAGRETKRMK